MGHSRFTRRCPLAFLILVLSLSCRASQEFLEWLGPWARDPAAIAQIQTALARRQFVHVRTALALHAARAVRSSLAEPGKWEPARKDPSFRTDARGACEPRHLFVPGASCDAVLGRVSAADCTRLAGEGAQAAGIKLSRKRRLLTKFSAGSRSTGGVTVEYAVGRAFETVSSVAWKESSEGARNRSAPDVAFRRSMSSPEAMAFFADLVHRSVADDGDGGGGGGDANDDDDDYDDDELSDSMNLTLVLRPSRLGPGDFVVPHEDSTGFVCEKGERTRDGSRDGHHHPTEVADARELDEASTGCRVVAMRRLAIIFHFCGGALNSAFAGGSGGLCGGDLVFCNPAHHLRCTFNSLTMFRMQPGSYEGKGRTSGPGWHMITPVTATPACKQDGYERLAITGWLEETFESAVARVAAGRLRVQPASPRAHQGSGTGRPALYPAGIIVEEDFLREESLQPSSPLDGAGKKQTTTTIVVSPTFSDSVLQLMPIMP